MGTKRQIGKFLSKYPEYKTSVGLYNPEKYVIEKIRGNLEDLEIKVFYGEWCPDCRLELPRFISVINVLDTDDMDIEFIELKRNKNDWIEKANEHKVFAVPTFVFFRYGNEIGRIIERPRVSMEWDFAEIVQ